MVETSPEFSRLLAPIRAGRRELRNRVIMGSMHTRLETEPDGIARLAAFYRERALGEAGLIVTGGFAPNPEGRFDPAGPRLDEPGAARALAPVTAAVHAAGGLICAQLCHAGRYAKFAGCVAPSALRAPINPHTPRALDEADILRTIEDFAQAAANAREAGFDGVEIMGSEGYLINEFTVLRTNRRDDRWGGSVANRQRFPVAVVAAVRARCGPDFLIIYRISVADLVADGAPAAEIAALARAVEAAGADILNSGIGWHEARVPTIAYPVPRGAWRRATARLKGVVAIPLVASNRINTPETAEEILRMGEADMVSMARPWLADPHFMRKLRQGRAAEINPCIACNQACLDYIFSERPVGCLVNPGAGREAEPAPVARGGRRLAVVGGGAAGMAAAAEAARLGHDVTLFEAQARLGGQLLLARAVPGKQEFDGMLGYYAGELARRGVRLRLHQRARVEDLAGFDQVAIATGVRPRIPDLPGIGHPKVATYAEILSGQRVAGGVVAVMGAGGIGHDLAEFLVSDPAPRAETFFQIWGVDAEFAAPGALLGDPLAPVAAPRRVVLLQRKPGKPGLGLGVSTGWILRNLLRKYGVETLTGVAYQRIDDAGLHLRVAGQDRVIAADTIVLCTGQEPERALAPALAQRGIPAALIGGARAATALDAQRAIDEGVRLARAL